MTPPRAATTNADLSQQVGDVREQVGALIEGQRAAERGRGVLHEKIDRVLDAVQVQAVAMAGISKDAALAVQVAAQTRDRLDAFDREVSPTINDLKTSVHDFKGRVTDLETAHTDAAPLLDTVKQARNLLAVLIVIAGSSAVGVGAIFAFFNDAARQAVRSWLGIA